jgi:cytochrome c oxidase assembly protein subunit 15
VLLFLPAPVSVAHAGLAQIFFCLTVSLALFTSPGWLEGYRSFGGPVDDRGLRRGAVTTAALIYAQILVGAAMRHTGAGLAIPDFPLAFGGLVPHEWNAAIALHYTHRLGALVVALAIVATCGRVWARHRERGDLLRPAMLASALVIAQIALGGFTVLSRKAVAINTAHVVCGALVLASMLILTLRAFRLRFAGGTEASSRVPESAVVDRCRAPAGAGANA